MMRLLNQPTLPFDNLPNMGRRERPGCYRKAPPMPPQAQQGNLKIISVFTNPLPRQNTRKVIIRVVNGNISEKIVDFSVRKYYKNLSTFYRVFVADEVTQLSDYVPRRKYAYLDKHFRSWVMRVPKLRKLGHDLQQIGAVTIADVVLMTEEQLREAVPVDDKIIQILKDDLATVGLKLGMKLPPSAPFISRFQAR